MKIIQYIQRIMHSKKVPFTLLNILSIKALAPYAHRLHKRLMMRFYSWLYINQQKEKAPTNVLKVMLDTR